MLNVTQAQQNKPLYENPVFLVSDIPPKIEMIKREYTKVKGIPKPRKVHIIIIFLQRKEKKEDSKGDSDSKDKDADDEN